MSQINSMNHYVVIKWLGHACFKVTGDGYSIVLDPYEDNYVPGFGVLRVTANQVLCSHEHHDHGYTEAVEIQSFEGECPWHIRNVDSWHDEQEGALRGANRIHILELDNLRIVHMGDQGCLLTDEQITAICKPDVLLIPVGGFYTIDAPTAKQIADRLKARVIIPMHYQGEGFGFDVLGTVGAFTDLYDQVVYYDSNSITIDAGTEAQVAVLKKWNETE